MTKRIITPSSGLEVKEFGDRSGSVPSSLLCSSRRASWTIRLAMIAALASSACSSESTTADATDPFLVASEDAGSDINLPDLGAALDVIDATDLDAQETGTTDSDADSDAQETGTTDSGADSDVQETGTPETGVNDSGTDGSLECVEAYNTFSMNTSSGAAMVELSSSDGELTSFLVEEDISDSPDIDLSCDETLFLTISRVPGGGFPTVFLRFDSAATDFQVFVDGEEVAVPTDGPGFLSLEQLKFAESAVIEVIGPDSSGIDD